MDDANAKIADELIGVLKLLDTGRYGIVYRDGTIDEITSGDSLFLEIPGGGKVLGRTRIETQWNHKKGAMEYYSVDGLELREGLRGVKTPNLF